MRELEKPVARVFRRLRYQRFVTTLVWSFAVGLVIVAGVIGAEKLMGRNLPAPDWVPFAAAGAMGMMVAAGFAIFSGPSRLDAAVAIDRVFHLNERLSSALTLPEDLRQTPAGIALIADAVKKVTDLDVAAEFGLRLPRRAWVVLIPATASVLLLFAPAWVVRNSAQAKSTEVVDTKAMAKQTQALTKKIASQRENIDKEKFPEAEKLLAQIQKKTDDLAKAPPAAKDKLMVELNSLTDALKERQKQLGTPEQVNRQLKQLKDMGSQGPADDFAKDLARGDFMKAAEELKKLQEKIQSNKLTEAEKKALKEQLGEMAKKLNDLANMEQRKKQLEEARKNGGLSQQQYEREMEKLQEQAKGLKQLQQLANKMSQAQEAMQKGDMKKAAEAMGMSQQQLQEMAKQLEEMQALDSAMADLQDAKNGMPADMMNQLGDDLNALGKGMGDRRKGNGNGMGRGRGQGDRPEAPDDTSTYKAKVPNQIGKGKAVMQGFTTPSKTVKGQTVVDIQGELEAGSASYADALSNQKIPKNVEKHIRSYYDQLNKGR
jgi:myosin heavy subunit